MQPRLRTLIRSRAGFGVACTLAAALWIGLGAIVARAHEGDDHQHRPAVATAAMSLPRIVAHSESYELVGIVEGERLTIYLDRFDDNSPITEAAITVTIEGEPVTAESAADRTFTLTSKRFSDGGPVELVFDIKAPVGDDLLVAGAGGSGRPQAYAAGAVHNELVPQRLTVWPDQCRSVCRQGT